MGTDLDVFYSHPNKLLEKHINGVLEKARKRTSLQLAEIAILFHDLGKINPNFQEKLKPENKGKYLGYSGHSYLSTFIFLCYYLENNQSLKEALGITENRILKLQVQRITAIIAHHHGNLPDLDKNLKEDPKHDVLSFLNSFNPFLPASEFYSYKLSQQHQPFNLDLVADSRKQQIFKLVHFSDKEEKVWQEDALHYFLDTQFAFATLIEADKRDAGNNDNYFFEAQITTTVAELNKELDHVFANFKAESELNRLRTQLREEAIIGLKEGLQTGNRIFTLTAPTGAGKTYTLLALAAEIQKMHPELGILYALPFLSITEQVEDICRWRKEGETEKGLLKEILSINFKAINNRVQSAQENLEKEQSPDNLKRLLEEDFIGQTFDHPFIITTFVQFFETLVSNRNSTLLKLPNFSKRIFLIDEIQTLPPRLYIFFAGWLSAFCRKYDSYAILSTATMPDFALPIKNFLEDNVNPAKLFKSYLEPFPILDAKKFFKEDVFNRYKIINLIKAGDFTIEQVAYHVLEQATSCLIILNTIKDSKQLFQRLKDAENVYLLNTHFTPADRRRKIEIIKKHLEKKERVILISTQLIEAGVDIDFPVVYRDLCPLPSLIQSAGRCNRNKKLAELGQVYFFHLINDKGKSSANSIYRKEAKQFLEYCKENIPDTIEEKDLYELQEGFFKFIAKNLTIGETDKDLNLIEFVNKAQFEKLGQFKLIDEKDFGKEYQYYIPENEKDFEYDKAVELMRLSMIEKEKGYEYYKAASIKLNQQLKKLADRLITIRTLYDDKNIPDPSNNPEYFDIKVLADLSLYTFEEGFNHSSVANAFL